MRRKAKEQDPRVSAVNPEAAKERARRVLAVEADPANASGLRPWAEDVLALAARLATAETALTEIATKQPETLEKLRSHGVVFDGPLGNDPKNWQHVAFSIYTDLCEVDSIARAALSAHDTEQSER